MNVEIIPIFIYFVLLTSPVFFENVFGTIWTGTRQAQKLAISVRILVLFINRVFSFR